MMSCVLHHVLRAAAGCLLAMLYAFDDDVFFFHHHHKQYELCIYRQPQQKCIIPPPYWSLSILKIHVLFFSLSNSSFARGGGGKTYTLGKYENALIKKPPFFR